MSEISHALTIDDSFFENERSVAVVDEAENDFVEINGQQIPRTEVYRFSFGGSQPAGAYEKALSKVLLNLLYQATDTGHQLWRIEGRTLEIGDPGEGKLYISDRGFQDLYLHFPPNCSGEIAFMIYGSDGTRMEPYIFAVRSDADGKLSFEPCFPQIRK